MEKIFRITNRPYGNDQKPATDDEVLQLSTDTVLANELSASKIKKKYESNIDTNVFDDAAKNKLARINNTLIATDFETQITSVIVEDNKVISRLKLFNWWNWIKSLPLKWNNTITTLTGTNTSAPLIIPNGTLTTTPQNGSIERDANGVLWETNSGIRKKITPTINFPSTLLCTKKNEGSISKKWNLELILGDKFYTVLASGTQNSILAFCGLNYNDRPAGSKVFKDSEYEYTFNLEPDIKIGFLSKENGNNRIIDLDTFLESSPVGDNTSYKKYKNLFRIAWNTHSSGSFAFYIVKSGPYKYITISPDTINDFSLIAYTTNPAFASLPGSNLVFSSIYYSEELFKDNFIIS